MVPSRTKRNLFSFMFERGEPVLDYREGV